MADAPVFQERRDFFIDGDWVPAKGRSAIDVIAANTEEPLGRVSDASPEDIDRAVASARRAFDTGPFPDWTPAERAERIATRVRTGCVAVNSAMIVDLRSPFGGFKKSGIGRELGPEGLAPYTEYQSIILPPQS